MSEQPQPTPATPGEEAPRPGSPGLEESLREVRDSARGAASSARLTAKAMRRLIAADFALARSAFGRALAWAGAAIVFGASAWFLIAGTIIALLQRSGFSWFQSLLFTALGSLVITVFAAWRVSHYFDYTGMHATRRQLSRFGLFDEDSDDDEDGAAPVAKEPAP